MRSTNETLGTSVIRFQILGLIERLPNAGVQRRRAISIRAEQGYLRSMLSRRVEGFVRLRRSWVEPLLCANNFVDLFFQGGEFQRVSRPKCFFAATVVMVNGFSFAINSYRCFCAALIGPHIGTTILYPGIAILQRKEFDAFKLRDEQGNFIDWNFCLDRFRCSRSRICSVNERVCETLEDHVPVGLDGQLIVSAIIKCVGE